VIVWLWCAAAMGHGGPPSSDALLWDDAGDMIVASSHGLFFADGDWDWVCDEIFGTSLPSDVVRIQDRLWVSTTSGLAWSTTGCDWTWLPVFEGEMVWDLAVDPEVPDKVWALTEDGLWQSTDSGSNFSFAGTPASDASLRSFIRMPNGTWTVLGFLDGQATAWREDEERWASAQLPVDGGQLIALGTDPAGNAYGRFPLASGADELLRLEPDGSVYRVLVTDQPIGAFLSIDDVLLVSVPGAGTSVSTDQGRSWTSRDPQTLRCLTVHEDRIWGCPDDDRNLLWVHTDMSFLDEQSQWTQGPRFNDTDGPRCDALAECDAVWPQVAQELGLTPALEAHDTGLAVSEAAPAPRCGCNGRSAMVLAPWALLGIRRRRAG